MRTFANNAPSTQRPFSLISPKDPERFLGKQSSRPGSIRPQQRAVGNHAVGRLLRAGKDNEDGWLPSAPPHLAHDFSRIPVLASAGTGIQPKLKVGAPGDKLEREADRAAEQVMSMDGPDGSPGLMGISAPQDRASSGELIQRLSGDRSPSFADAVVVEEEESVEGTLQALRRPNQETGTGVVSRQQLNRSQGGVPLERNARQFMETRFGADFSAVKVHADSHAVGLCRSLNARAFTYGSRIYFGSNEYQPDSQAGRRVLAHELTHVVQQGAGRSSMPALQHVKQGRSAHSPMAIQRLSRRGRVLRHFVRPWGAGGPEGTDYEVTTDAGSKVTGWQAYSPYQARYRYWCHGHSTGSFVDDDYSVYSGPHIATVISDEYRKIGPAQTRAGDLAVWTHKMHHSAIFTSPVKQNGKLVSGKSLMSTKNGDATLRPMTLAKVAREYGYDGIGIFRRK